MPWRPIRLVGRTLSTVTLYDGGPDGGQVRKEKLSRRTRALYDSNQGAQTVRVVHVIEPNDGRVVYPRRTQQAVA